MSEYFQVLHAEDEQYAPFGVAYAPEDTDLHLVPISGEKVITWSSINLDLRDGDFADYLANDLGARLCSLKLKNIIEENLSQIDEVQWLESTVINSSGLEKKYYILHFPVNYEVIDRDKSIIVNEKFIVKGILNYSAVQSRHVFTYPNEAGRRFFINKELKKNIEDNNCTGISFFKIPISK
jgi:hypothetical protein